MGNNQDLVNTIKKVRNILFNEKLLTRFTAALYNTYTKNPTVSINESCELYYDERHHIHACFTGKVKKHLERYTLRRGQKLNVAGYINAYAAEKNDSISSPILQVNCIHIDVLDECQEQPPTINRYPKRLPLKINKIALLTSEDSEVKKDFMTAIGPENEHLVNFINTRILGAEAIDDIASQISKLNSDRSADVICIVRGGGPEQEISNVFDSQEVYFAIRSSSIPVLVGIGHEANFTNADRASDSPLNAAGEKTSYANAYALGTALKEYLSKNAI